MFEDDVEIEGTREAVTDTGAGKVDVGEGGQSIGWRISVRKTVISSWAVGDGCGAPKLGSSG